VCRPDSPLLPQVTFLPLHCCTTARTGLASKAGWQRGGEDHNQGCSLSSVPGGDHGKLVREAEEVARDWSG